MQLTYLIEVLLGSRAGAATLEGGEGEVGGGVGLQTPASPDGGGQPRDEALLEEFGGQRVEQRVEGRVDGQHEHHEPRVQVPADLHACNTWHSTAVSYSLFV